MNNLKIDDKDLPGLFQSADSTSNCEQKRHFRSIKIYLCLLITAAGIAFADSLNPQSILKIIAVLIFLSTLSITIWRKMQKPDKIWYNGRAVAESVKTRAWRFMMCAEPYYNNIDDTQTRKIFVSDLKEILTQNENLIEKIGSNASLEEPITDKMLQVRKLDLQSRFLFYRDERITNQALWYNKKTKSNKKTSDIWFWITVGLHAIAITLLLCAINNLNVKLPIGIMAACASSVLTWIQAKKFDELASSYSLTAHEIILLKSEVVEIKNEDDFSDFVLNCETAFSREHTQWFARKTN